MCACHDPFLTGPFLPVEALSLEAADSELLSPLPAAALEWEEEEEEEEVTGNCLGVPLTDVLGPLAGSCLSAGSEMCAPGFTKTNKQTFWKRRKGHAQEKK